jgi:3-hydroxyisobutyrate dehydrogenase
MLETLAFVGVGNMGNPMAANLIAAGYPLRVFDTVAARCDNLVASGAVRATSIADAVASASVVLLSLPGPPQVEAVMLGPGGVLASAARGTRVIDTSTSSGPLLQRIVAAASEVGVEVLECPVTNAIDGAVRGELTLFTAGDPAVLEAVRPILEVVSSTIHFVGKHGNAAVVKLLTNQLWFVSAAALGEALNTSAGDSWVVRHDTPSIFAGHYDPSFSLALCCKDLGLIQEIAAEQGQVLPMTTLAQERFEAAKARYGADAGELHVARLIEEAAGLLLRPPHGEPI